MSEKLIMGGPVAGYKYEFREDGVYLTVYPQPDGERLFELSDMRQILRECKVLDYDVGLLSRTLREASGREQKIADMADMAAVAAAGGVESAAEEEYAGIVLEVSRDRMQARIKYDTRAGTRLPTVEMVKSTLSAAGVKYGISEGAIAAGVQSYQPFVCAEGTLPLAGENAYIDRKFNLGQPGKPIIDELGKADYKDLNLFVLVKENQTLAIRIPQTKGTPGRNIFGEEVPAQSGRPCPMPEGKNTRVVGEHRLIATVNGQIVDKGSRINVDPRLELKGGVGVQTGDIEFDGTISIKGDVESGFKVAATGDIEIKGSVNGAQVTGRNVYISGGVTGAERAKVIAAEDIRTTFAENAVLEAGGSLFISDIALHSQLRAGKVLAVGSQLSVGSGKLSAKKGQIVGGLAIAGEEINVKQLGNSASVVTKVAVGVDPNLQREYVELRKSYKESKRRLVHITQTLNTLSKIDVNKLPKSRLESINALTRSQFPLAGQIKRQQKRILEIEEQLSAMKHGRIRVSDTIYPGVRLSVNNVQKSIQSEYKHCTLSLNDSGEVEVGPY